MENLPRLLVGPEDLLLTPVQCPADRCGGATVGSVAENEPASADDVSLDRRLGSRLEPELDSEWDWEAALKDRISWMDKDNR